MSETLSQPKRVIGMHFFNPAEKMQLVELVCGSETSEATIAYAAALISGLGKYPVVVQDVPGFLVNRTLTPYLVEGAYLLSEGFSVSQIDKTAKKFGMPMGPFQLLDEIGLDIAAKVSQIMETKYGIRMQGPKHAEELTAKGLYGKKSGSGFYNHQGKKRTLNTDVPQMLGLTDVKPTETSKDELEKRLIYPFVNEAIRCLDDGVCGVPGKEAACQIDLASVFGTGFAPFRGGIISYAESVGAKELATTLSSYAKKYGERYEPAPGIKKRAENGKSFYESAD